MSVSKITARIVHLPQEQFFERGTPSDGAGIAQRLATGTAIIAIQQKTGSRAVSQAVRVGCLDIASQLNTVVPLDPGKVLGPVVGLVGCGGNGISLNPANISGQGAHVDIRNPEISGVERTRVDTEALGVDFVVDLDDLRETVPTETAFQDFVGAHVPG